MSHFAVLERCETIDSGVFVEMNYFVLLGINFLLEGKLNG